MSSIERLSGDEQTFLRHYPSTPHLDKYRTTPNPKINNNNKSTVLLNASNSNINLMSQSYMPKTTLSTFSSHKSRPDVRYQDDPNPYKVSDIGQCRIKVQDPFVPKSFNRSQQVLHCYSDNDSVSNRSEEGGDVFSRRRTLEKYESQSQNGEDILSVLPTRVQRSQTLKSSSGSHKSSGSSSRGHLTGRSSRVSGSMSTCSVEDAEECEIPEPDYEHEGSTGGSSEDIPLPIPESSCSEEYSSVSAGSDPDHYIISSRVGQSPSPENIQSDRNGADSGLDTPTKIANEDRVKIEYALKGRKTTVFVSDSLANLYLMKKPGGPRSQVVGGAEDWVLKYTGVPVLLLDSGETKSRDKRRIQIVLAELGSGLALWKDVIDNLTSYKVMEGSNTFHSFHFSQDHSKIIGLSFDDEESAVNFSGQVDKLTSDFANISLSGSKSKKKNKKDSKSSKPSKPAKFVKPKKSEISQPCCFQHVSSLRSTDQGRLSSLQNFILNSDTDTETPAFVSGRVSVSSGTVVSTSPAPLSLPPKTSVGTRSNGSEISF